MPGPSCPRAPHNPSLDRYERIIALHRTLRGARYPVTVLRLQDELGCSRATVYRDLAFLRDALMAPVVGDGEAGFRYDPGEGDRFELPGLWLTSEDLHALHRQFAARGVFVQQLLDPLLQWRQRVRQHPARVARQQLLRGEQGVQFLGRQPQPRQLEAVALVRVVAEAGVAVADHRRHQGVAQEGKVAIDGRSRAAEFVLQARHGHRVARGAQDAVQGDDAFVAVHGGDYGARRVAA